MGHRFVDGSVIRARMQAKDDRVNAQLRRDYPMQEPELIAAERTLATSPPSLMPVFRGQEITDALHAYLELQRALDAGMPDQLMNIRGRMFRKKGYWRAIATAFNLNVSCVKEESDDYGWRVVYRASTPSGRFAEGDGACENDEKGDGQDTEHNVRSHAHTRAFNRAVSNLVGFGEVSAEEMRHDGQTRSAPTPPPPAILPGRAERENTAEPPVGERGSLPPGAVYIERIDYTKTKNPRVTKHLLTMSNGETFSTIKDRLAAQAEAFRQAREPVWVTGTPTRWGQELVSLTAAEGEGPVYTVDDDERPPF